VAAGAGSPAYRPCSPPLLATRDNSTGRFEADANRGAGSLAALASPQVIPEGAGPVKGTWPVFLAARRLCWTRRGKGSASRLGRSPTAERPEGLEAGPVRRTMSSCRVLGFLFWGCVGAGVCCLVIAGCPAGWSELVLLGHPFGVAETRWWRVGPHDGVRKAGGVRRPVGVNQRGRPRRYASRRQRGS
jgi:hypothetical protein